MGNSRGGRRYELVFRLHYTEVYTDLSEQDKFLEWNLGRQISVSTEGGEEMFKDIAGVSFFNWVVSQLENNENESDVLKRVLKMDAVELILTAGNDDLNTYMQVNEPVTGVVTERPIFTNVNNGYVILLVSIVLNSPLSCLMVPCWSYVLDNLPVSLNSVAIQPI